MPKRAAACQNLKEKSFRISEKSSRIERTTDQVEEEEIIAVRLTSGKNETHQNRRLTDFIVHDKNGIPKPLEMLEVSDMFISGLILPFEESNDKKREKGVRCNGFGRIETWDISGYEDGSPVIWLSTGIADYYCLKPAITFKKHYDLFYEKANACVEVYKTVSLSAGGDPNLSLDELLAGMVRVMCESKSFTGTASVKEFVISHGEFIYNQLIGLDNTAKTKERMFADLQVLVALRDESCKQRNYEHAQVMPSAGTLTIGSGTGDEGNKSEQSNLMTSLAVEDEDAKLARLLQEKEDWASMKSRKTRRSASRAGKYYI
ncbi:hypothetical protein L6164_037035 [Bauhinia variegata]|uniref:Uncharacterized protein n=1 Tax=Bauhinia variegata TaxID=167791 RepID=A0ACB9KJ03_BAUVA|nr:hypothetical protein L6164_037035 [Bauhinia variegata]